MDVTEFFTDFARLGPGWVMYLLILLSIISIGVMIDRFLWFRARDTDCERFTKELKSAIDHDELDRFIGKHKDNPAVPVQVAIRGLDERKRGVEAVAEAMHGEKSRWRRAGDSNLIVLGTLGNNVPFVGLFGTVLGVIKAFDQFQTDKPGADKLVIAELSKALTATAVGLLVAIPAVVAYNYFSRRLKVILGGADECAHAVLSNLYGREPQDKKKAADGGA